MTSLNAAFHKSWRLKIGRAKEHFAGLETEIKEWVGTNPIIVTKEKNADGRTHDGFAEVVNPPPLHRWALISGDCVHNLRSALDSIVYGIAIHEENANPPSEAKMLQFPIAASDVQFSNQKNWIKSLSLPVQSVIEKAQPYNVPHQEYPPLLELLGSLNNIDKHRTINLMAPVPHRVSISMATPSLGTDVYRTAIEGKTKIFSFTIEPGDPDLKYRCETVVVICVAHSPGPSKSPFSELVGVLHSLIAEVERIVDELETIVGEMQSVPGPTLAQHAHFPLNTSD